jgi:hypothetical protein
MANPPRQGSNFLEYNPAKEVLSQEAWNANSALTFYKLLKNLRQTAKLLPLVHPQASKSTSKALQSMTKSTKQL